LWTETSLPFLNLLPGRNEAIFRFSKIEKILEIPPAPGPIDFKYYVNVSNMYVFVHLVRTCLMWMLTLLAVVFSNTCVDVNECLYDNGGCEHTCINTWSSRECRYLYSMPGVLVPHPPPPPPGNKGTLQEFRETWCQVRTIQEEQVPCKNPGGPVAFPESSKESKHQQ
jgi:hypothetical protein